MSNSKLKKRNELVKADINILEKIIAAVSISKRLFLENIKIR